MIIEPCCCHKQIPSLCRENKDRLTVFHTNGDVTIEKMFHAAGCLVGPADCTIVTPSITKPCADYIQYAITRGWIKSLRLLLSPENKISHPIFDNANVIYDSRITESSALFIIEGETNRLLITGYLPSSSPADTDNKYRLVNHNILYTSSEPPASLLWDEVTYIPLSSFRVRR